MSGSALGREMGRMALHAEGIEQLPRPGGLEENGSAGQA